MRWTQQREQVLIAGLVIALERHPHPQVAQVD